MAHTHFCRTGQESWRVLFSFSLKRFKICRKGASALEFAIVSPLLFLMIAGILVYGVYFGAVHSVQQLAAEAARATVAGLSDNERATLANGHVRDSASSYPLLDPGRLQTAAQASPADSELFVVTVTYDASNLGVLGLTGLVPGPSQTIQRSAIVRRGGY